MNLQISISVTPINADVFSLIRIWIATPSSIAGQLLFHRQIGVVVPAVSGTTNISQVTGKNGASLYLHELPDKVLFRLQADLMNPNGMISNPSATVEVQKGSS